MSLADSVDGASLQESQASPAHQVILELQALVQELIWIYRETSRYILMRMP
jgi:hypothetical protein